MLFALTLVGFIGIVLSACGYHWSFDGTWVKQASIWGEFISSSWCLLMLIMLLFS